MQQWLISIATNHDFLVYLIVVILSCLEGPFLSLLAGVLLNVGYFSFFPLYFALMLGDLIGDVVWYYIGHHFGHRFIKRFGKYFHITEEGITKMTEVFHKHKYPILFISKATNGFGFALATLVTAGMIKIPFGKYLTINVVGQFVWTGFLLTVGYFFGNWYIRVNNILGRMFIVGIFAIIFVAFMRYKKYLQTRANKLDTL